MMNLNHQIINLLQFDRTIVQRVAERFSTASSRHWRALAFSELTACFFWLDLGVEAEYFPKREASSLVAQRYTHFFGDFDSEFASYGDMFDPLFKVLLEGAQSHRDPFLHEPWPGSTGPGAVVRACLRTGINAEATLVTDLSAEMFQGCLNFAPQLIDEVIDRGHAIQRSNEPILDRSAIEKGCGVMVSYMQSMVGLSRLIFGESAMNNEQRASLERRIRQITRWRINRFRYSVDTHFIKAVRFATESRGLKSTQASMNWIRVLLSDWGFTHSKSISA